MACMSVGRGTPKWPEWDESRWTAPCKRNIAQYVNSQWPWKGGKPRKSNARKESFSVEPPRHRAWAGLELAGSHAASKSTYWRTLDTRYSLTTGSISNLMAFLTWNRLFCTRIDNSIQLNRLRSNHRCSHGHQNSYIERLKIGAEKTCVVGNLFHHPLWNEVNADNIARNLSKWRL